MGFENAFHSILQQQEGGWKSTFCDNLQISWVHSFMKYSHSKLDIFLYLSSYQDFRIIEQNLTIFCMKDNSAVVEGRKRPNCILQKWRYRKTAEAENWNLAAHWRLGSERHLTAVIQHLTFRLQTSKVAVLLVIFPWATVWIPKGTSVLLSDRWIWSRIENGTHPLLGSQLNC